MPAAAPMTHRARKPNGRRTNRPNRKAASRACADDAGSWRAPHPPSGQPPAQTGRVRKLAALAGVDLPIHGLL
eukprot:10004303-Lingulodinium_polyedra.AAC.1